MDRVGDLAGRRRRRGRRRLWLAAAAATVLGLGLVAYEQFPGLSIPGVTPGPEAGPAQPEAGQGSSVAPGGPSPSAEQPPESLPETPLPPLAESDTLVRELADGLSRQPTFSAWLSVNGLIQRFVAVIDNVADGVIPRSLLSFLAPREVFQTVTRQGRLYIDPRSYDRYDATADVLASLDPQRAVQIYQQLRPLCEEAYRNLGHPQGRLEDVVARALRTLLATPVVEGAIEVRPKVITYAFADPKLEALSPAQKQLLRVGPRNERLVQEQLRALASALGSTEGGPASAR